MDVFKPYMAPIVRLKVAHNGPFKIVGVLDNKAEKIKGKSLANQIDSELKEKSARNLSEESGQNAEADENEQDHLDTWA